MGLSTLSLSNQYITSLEGLGVQPGLKTLFLQNNFLQTLDHLFTQPALSELHLEGNRLVSLRGLHPQPSLERIWLKGNPVHTHIQTHEHTRPCPHTHTCMHACMHAHTHTHTHTLNTPTPAPDKVCGHEFSKTMCLMAVGTSLLRIDDLGIIPEIREQAMMMGARAAEAVREVCVCVWRGGRLVGGGWMPRPCTRCGWGG